MPKLKTLEPRLKPASQAVAAFAPKKADPYYHTPEWRRLREACFARDCYVCVVPGCGKPAVVADHRKPRRDGGSDELWNLQSLCRAHDNASKENHLGQRRGRDSRYAKGG